MSFHPLFWLSKRLTDVAVRISGPNGVEYAFHRAADRLGSFGAGCDGKLGYFFGDVRDQFVHRVYRNTKTWDSATQDLFERIFARGGTLIDAGANIGLTSVPIAAKRPVTVHAFEPDPQNFRFLRANALVNGAADFHAYNLALMSEDGVLEFERSKVNWGDHRVRSAPGVQMDERQEVITVQGKRLDDVLSSAQLRPPVVLKVDTQGADVAVLRGASGVLGRVDFAVCEIWPYGLRRMRETCDALYEALSPFPFAAILGEPEVTLVPLQDAIARIRARIPEDGSDPEGLVDLFLSKTPNVGP